MKESISAQIPMSINAPTPIGNKLIIANDDLDQTKPAVAYAGTSGNYMVAWMDHNPTYPAQPERGQIYWKFVYSNGTISNSAWFKDGVYNSSPDIAYDSVHNRFLVVWENHCHDRDYWDISAIQINASTGQVVGDITPIFRGEEYHFRDPAVIFNPEDGEFLVVAKYQGRNWSDKLDWDINARRVQPKTDGSLTVFGYAENNNGIGLAVTIDPEIAPDVAYDNEANAYLVVWEREGNDGIDPDKIEARTVNPNGSLSGNTVDIISNISDAETPKVTYNPKSENGQFLLVYEQGDTNVKGQRIWSSYPNPVTAYGPFDIAASSSEEDNPEVAFSESCNCYMVTYDSDMNYIFKIFAQQVYGIYDDAGQLDGNPLKIVESQWGFEYGGLNRNNATACSSTSSQCLTVWEYGDEVRDVIDVHGQRSQCSYSGSASIYLPIIVKNSSNGTIFFDDFSDPGSGWATGETDNYLVEYKTGEYRIVGKNEESIIRATAPDQANCQNCSIEVDARFSGEPNNGYGIVFSYGQGDDAGDYYAFIAYPYADTCNIVKNQDYSGSLLNRAGCNLTDGSNHLKVTWNDTIFKTYVNGVLANDITQAGVYNNDAVGLIVFYQGDAYFDNFKVTR